MASKIIVDGKDGPVTYKVRTEVAEFAIRMEKKLAKKDGEGKTHWLKLPVAALRKFLGIEIEELHAAIDYLSTDEQQGECIDVANYAMILWDRIGAGEVVEENPAHARMHHGEATGGQGDGRGIYLPHARASGQETPTERPDDPMDLAGLGRRHP